jgi:hypothetical protein
MSPLNQCGMVSAAFSFYGGAAEPILEDKACHGASVEVVRACN